jgi:hypothetical protein
MASTLLGLVASAPSAVAMRFQAGGSPGGLTARKSTAPTTVVTTGLHGWQITVIVAVAVLVASSVAVVVYRLKTTHGARVIPAA